MKSALLNYYRQINRPGKALSDCWPDLEEIGLGDPRIVLSLNQELIADGSIRVVRGRNMWESDEYFIQ
jgi:hypothetical protein